VKNNTIYLVMKLKIFQDDTIIKLVKQSEETIQIAIVNYCWQNKIFKFTLQ